MEINELPKLRIVETKIKCNAKTKINLSRTLKGKHKITFWHMEN